MKLPPRPTNRLLKDHLMKRQGIIGLMARAFVNIWVTLRAMVTFLSNGHEARLSLNSTWIHICTWIRIQKTLHWMTGAERKILLRWVQDKIRLRNVTNFGSDWCDGVALCALMDALVPGTCPRYDLLNPEESYLNLKRGLRVAETQLGVTGLVKLEDFYSDQDILIKNLTRFLALLRLKVELNPKFEPAISGDINGNKELLVEGVDTEEALRDISCMVRGMGLQLAVKGRKSRFNIYLKTNCCLDLVIEIKGSEGDYFTERITTRSPRRKSLVSTQEPRIFSKTTKGLLTSGQLVTMPFEYEVNNGKVSVGYVPLHSGRYKLTIICRGKHVTGSPFTVNVDESIEVPDHLPRPPRRLLPKGSSFDDDVFSVCSVAPGPRCLRKEGDGEMTMVTRRKVLKVIRRVVVRSGVEIPFEDYARDAYSWSAVPGGVPSNELGSIATISEQSDAEGVFEAEDQDKTFLLDTQEDTDEGNFFHSTPNECREGRDFEKYEGPPVSKFYCPEIDTILETTEFISNDIQNTDTTIILHENGGNIVADEVSVPFDAKLDEVEMVPDDNGLNFEDMFFKSSFEHCGPIEIDGNLIDLRTPRSSCRKCKTAGNAAVTPNQKFLPDQNNGKPLNINLVATDITIPNALLTNTQSGVTPEIQVNGEISECGVEIVNHPSAPDGEAGNTETECSGDKCDLEVSNCKKMDNDDKYEDAFKMVRQHFEKAEVNTQSADCESKTARTPHYSLPSNKRFGDSRKDKPVPVVRKLPAFLQSKSQRSEACISQRVLSSSVREKVNRWEKVSANTTVEITRKPKL